MLKIQKSQVEEKYKKTEQSSFRLVYDSWNCKVENS